MLDLLAGRDRAPDPDVGLDMPDDANPLRLRFLDQGIVERTHDAEGHLHEIVARRLHVAHRLPHLMRRGHDARIVGRLGGEVRARDPELRAVHLSRLDLPPEDEMLRRSDHEARGRDTVRQHHPELRGGRRIRDGAIGVEVRVHVREPRHQVAATGHELPGAARHRDRRRRPHRDDPAVPHEHRRIANDGVGGHRDDVGTDDGPGPTCEKAARRVRRRILGGEW